MVIALDHQEPNRLRRAHAQGPTTEAGGRAKTGAELPKTAV